MTNATKSKQRAGHPTKAARHEAERRRARHRWRLMGGVAAAAIVVTVAAVALSGGGTTDTPPSGTGQVSIARGPGPLLRAGETVPGFSAPALGGGTLRWAEYAGKPTVLTIWAPWCPHCQAELPRLAAAMAEHPDLRMVSVATAIGQEPGPSVQGYLDDHGLRFPVGVDDAQTTIMRGLGVNSFPTVYFVSADGKVVSVTTGELTATQLDSELARLGA
jgi:cytochrome c biogenesis protein CcmG, thiol:disulfide interchange protein DsbE